MVPPELHHCVAKPQPHGQQQVLRDICQQQVETVGGAGQHKQPWVLLDKHCQDCLHLALGVRHKRKGVASAQRLDALDVEGRTVERCVPLLGPHGGLDVEWDRSEQHDVVDAAEVGICPAITPDDNIAHVHAVVYEGLHDCHLRIVILVPYFFFPESAGRAPYAQG